MNDTREMFGAAAGLVVAVAALLAVAVVLGLTALCAT